MSNVVYNLSLRAKQHTKKLDEWPLFSRVTKNFFPQISLDALSGQQRKKSQIIIIICQCQIPTEPPKIRTYHIVYDLYIVVGFVVNKLMMDSALIRVYFNVQWLVFSFTRAFSRPISQQWLAIAGLRWMFDDLSDVRRGLSAY